MAIAAIIFFPLEKASGIPAFSGNKKGGPGRGRLE
jgi:hypothetical protein